MLYSGRHIIARTASWTVLLYATIALSIVLTEADLYLIEFAPILGGLPLGWSGFLGFLSIFLGVTLWDAVHTDGVKILRLYGSVGFILVPFGLVTIWALASQFYPTAGFGYGESRFVAFWPFINFLIVLFAVSFAAIPSVVKYHRYVFILSLAVLTFAVLWDYFFVGSFSRIEGRAAGLAIDPNTTAEILLVLSVVSVDWKRFSVLNGIIFLAAGVGIAPTLSRQGVLLYIFALGLYLALNLRLRPRAKPLLLFGVLAMLYASAFIYMHASNTLFFEGNQPNAPPETKHRLQEFTAIAEGDFRSLFGDERAGLATSYVDRIAQAPIFGYGTGFSTQIKGDEPHNIYLRQWIENGIIGLVLLLAFLFASFLYFMRYRYVPGMVFVTLFCLVGLFSHTLLAERPFLAMFGFLAAVAYVERSESPSVRVPRYLKREPAGYGLEEVPRL